MWEAPCSVAPQARRRDGVEEVGELAEAAEPECGPRPPAERREAARVVAKAEPPQYRVERAQVTFQARRPVADDLAAAERELSPGPEEQRVELLDLVPPIRGRPVADAAGAAEMTVEVRADLVAVLVAGLDPAQGPGDGEVTRREREADRRGAGVVV